MGEIGLYVRQINENSFPVISKLTTLYCNPFAQGFSFWTQDDIHLYFTALGSTQPSSRLISGFLSQGVKWTGC